MGWNHFTKEMKVKFPLKTNQQTFVGVHLPPLQPYLEESSLGVYVSTYRK